MHFIGKHAPMLQTQYLNGYLADVHFIDGQALAPTDFGETDDNGVWQPKEFVPGSYNDKWLPPNLHGSGNRLEAMSANISELYKFSTYVDVSHLTVAAWRHTQASNCFYGNWCVFNKITTWRIILAKLAFRYRNFHIRTMIQFSALIILVGLQAG